MYQLPLWHPLVHVVVSHPCIVIQLGRLYPDVPRGGAAQDVVIELIIRHASTLGSELNPETVGTECTAIVLFGDTVHQLHQRPGGVHRKSVAGEEQDGRRLRKSRIGTIGETQTGIRPRTRRQGGRTPL